MQRSLRWSRSLTVSILEGQSIVLDPDGFTVTNTGDLIINRGGIMDFSSSYVGKRYVFTGEIKEFESLISLRPYENGNPDLYNSPRVVVAAHRDYDLKATLTPPSLSAVGVVTIDSNGFVEGSNAKSGWVNMPATLTYEGKGSRVFVRLYDVSFWVTSGGQDWLSFSVDHATSSSDPTSIGNPVQIEAAIAITSKTSSGVHGMRRAQLRVGGHSFYAVLHKLSAQVGIHRDSLYSPIASIREAG